MRMSDWRSDVCSADLSTKHAQALQKLVAEQGVLVKKLPDDVMVAMGNAAGEVIAELREDSDELVKRIVESFITYRNSIAEYMVYADNGQMNARALVYKYSGRGERRRTEERVGGEEEGRK